ncbi:MAG: helix-turn-helix domain-containing protein [Proteobacteria bacterium]|nr:helix-turn-helix domain-containing protein [Pseudomonadota bacterium]
MLPKPIRAFARGLAVLAALNRHGSASALTLARETGVPRATVYRLLQTLLDEGYVGRGSADDRFHLRLKVRGLSGGFEDEQWIAAVAGPVLTELTRRISWPCDVATLEGLKMVIRETTHPIAPLSIDRNMAGQELPILASSSGMAYIAFAPPQERAALLALLARSDDAADALARDPAQAARLIAATRRRGYGLRQGGKIWPHTGAVALPIRAGRRVLGCINAIWMARALSHEEGVSRCLGPLREAQSSIERQIAAQQAG